MFQKTNTIDKKRLGKLGEDIALWHLRKIGMQLISRNLRLRNGEIDLLMLDCAAHVIVEVKTRTASSHAERFLFENIDRRKKMKLVALAQGYMRGQKKKLGYYPDCRIDLLGVIIDPNQTLKSAQVVHIKGAL